MELIILLILLLILAAAVAVGYYYGRSTGKPDEEIATLTEKARIWSGTATEKTRGWAGTAVETTKGWLRIGKSKKESARFVAWVTSLPGMDAAFKTWLESLAPQEAGTFTQRAASFGSGLNIDLAWFLDGQIDDAPELKQMAEEAMALYCQAYWKAALIRDDAEAFATFRAWQEAPKKHKELSRQVFARLVEAGTVSVSHELYLAPEKDRWDHIVKAIRDFAEKDRQAAIAIVKEVLAASSPTPIPVPAPTAEPLTKKIRRRGRKKAASPDTTEATA
jgi:hypothetical protein